MSVLKTMKQHKILLDTHVWIWLMNGDTTVSPRFRTAIERCAEREEILISPISVWELGMLVEKKRISLAMDRLDWVEQSLETPGMKLAPIVPRIAMQSTRLPGTVHGDPADRILIATARHYNAVLATRDEKILLYGKGKFIDVHDPCR